VAVDTSSAAQTEEAPKYQINIANLPYDIDEEGLGLLFTKYASDANIQSFVLKKSTKHTVAIGSSAVADFDSKEQAEIALAVLKTLVVHERILKVKLLDSTRSSDQNLSFADHSLSCYFGNLDAEVTENEIKDLCSECMEITKPVQVRMSYDRVTGWSIFIISFSYYCIIQSFLCFVPSRAAAKFWTRRFRHGARCSTCRADPERQDVTRTSSAR
jgi:RNA recognition motif-containing protein